MIKLKDIISEEVYGNKATVYHRTYSEQLLTSILSDGFIHNSGLYGEGIYTTYEPTKKTDWQAPHQRTGDPEKDNPEGRLNYEQYGPFQVKFVVDLINFFIFDWDVYQKATDHIRKVEKFTKKKSNINNFINLQAEYFNLSERINTEYRKRYTSTLALEFGFDENYRYDDEDIINGIVFFGSRDGCVLVCYNKELIIPISVTNTDTNKTINLQDKLKSDNTLRDTFKEYFKNFIKSKNYAMGNATKTAFDLALKKWKYDETTGLFSHDGNVKITKNFIVDGKLAIKFDVVEMGFECSNLPLTTLEGCPRKVGGYFDCSYTNMTSLHGAPEYVGGSFYCVGTPLKTLEGSPEIIVGDLQCTNTNIISLEGAPKIIKRNFSCINVKSLKTLRGTTQHIGGDAIFSNTGIESLDGMPIVLRNIDVSGCKSLKSLNGAPKQVNGNFDCRNTKITSLKGGPEKTLLDYDCSDTPLKTLNGAPLYVGRYFICKGCVFLKSLKYLPKESYANFVPNHLKMEYEELKKKDGNR